MIQTQRTLSASDSPFAHDFPVAVATTCYRSSYFSPYRVYALSVNTGDSDKAVFAFNVEVDQCPYSKAYCCSQNLDHLFVKIGELLISGWSCMMCMPSVVLMHSTFECHEGTQAVP